MSKSISILLLSLLVQSCSLFGSNEYNPELDVVSPANTVRGEYPQAQIGATLRVQANASVERDGLKRVVVYLYRNGDDRNPLSEIIYELSERPESAFVDAQLDIPAELTPSQADRDYFLGVRMEHGGGSIGHSLAIVLVE